MRRVVVSLAPDFVRRVVRRVLVPPKPQEWHWPSETSKCRDRLAVYCTGDGVDLGPGGDPINLRAVRVDLAQPYTRLGEHPVQLAGDASDLHWFREAVLDYVFSSHLLEDFEDTEHVLCEWLRVLKPGGRLVLFCPDEQAFRAHCGATGQPYNPHHKHADFSLAFVKGILGRMGGASVLYECALVDAYSWELVCTKDGSGPGVHGEERAS